MDWMRGLETLDGLQGRREEDFADGDKGMN